MSLLCFKLYLLLGLYMVLALVASDNFKNNSPICVTPEWWGGQALMTGTFIDGKYSVTNVMSFISYSAVQEKLLVQYILDPEETRLLFDYPGKTLYTITTSPKGNSTCTHTPLSGPFQPQCIPENATITLDPRTSFGAGDFLSYGWEASFLIGGLSYHVVMSANRLPMFEEVSGIQNGAMGTSTLLLSYQMKSGIEKEEVYNLAPEIVSWLIPDASIVHPEEKRSPAIGMPVVAVGPHRRSQAFLCFHKNGLFTVDVQYEVENESELLPGSKPYTLEHVRTLDKKIRDRLGDKCVRSTSLYVPIRRPSKLPKNYGVLADEKLVETDYTETVFEEQSPFQRVSIMQSKQFGRVLLLDEDIMLGESDEVYTKTLLGTKRGNKFGGTRVLVLGGGDGGVLNALVSLEEPPSFVLMAEIDEVVIKACRQHMKSVCGNVLDSYKGKNYKIQIKDCVEVLKNKVQKGRTFDYVINDLTEFSVQKDKHGFNYDYKANNTILELSFKVLKPGGKYLAKGNGQSATEYIQKVEKELTSLGHPFKRIDRHVPSFRESYSFFEVVKKTA